MTLNFRILQINLQSKKYISNFGTKVQIPKVLKDTVNNRGAQLQEISYMKIRFRGKHT